MEALTTDQPTTTSVRDAILARCDELERVAQRAAEVGETADRCAWGPLSRVDLPAAIGAHTTRWDPAAVLALVAGAREMVEIHAQVEGASADGDDPVIAVGCACGGATESLWGSCPTLAALARMLGVDHA